MKKIEAVFGSGATDFQCDMRNDDANEKHLLSRISLNPGELRPYLLLGDMLHREGRLTEAVSIYRTALSVNPEWGEIYHNLGNTLLALRAFPEALNAYIAAGRLMPGFAECRVTAATALQSMGRTREALAMCDRALAGDPGLAEAHWNRALVLLQLGNYAEGWREFEWRWQKRGYTTAYRDFPQQRWSGDPLNGRTILIHTEQAFGDVIMFSRFLPMVAAQGGKVLCECPGPLVRIIKQVPGISQVFPIGAALPSFDCHLPLLSLPYVFGISLDTLPAPPDLRRDGELISAWQKRLLPCEGLRVGLVWKGRSFPDPARSCPVQFLSPLGTPGGITFVSLQIENGAEDMPVLSQMLPLVDLTGEITDFADTAALIECLDLVITIDSAVAHLAGSLGRPTWVMLPFAADWRWLLDRVDSPWYPAMRLFRQVQADDWSEVIARVHAALVAARPIGTVTAFEKAYERGVEALQLGDLVAARLLLENALGLNPDVPEIYNALGVLAMRENDGDKAEQYLRTAIARDSNYADPLINLGNAEYEAGRIRESAGYLLRAVEIAPELPRSWQNLGVVLQGCGQTAAAFNCFHQALTLDPGYATARWNLANLELLTGDYDNGWRNYESRFLKSEPVVRRHQEFPLWHGEPLAGKRLLVHAEQGYGDTIQFSRYLRILQRFECRIIFEIPDLSLFNLFKSLTGVDDMVMRGETLPPVDVQVPLLSIPGILGTRLESVPHSKSYLAAHSVKRTLWGMRITRSRNVQVGLCWSGRPKPDPRRSCSLVRMGPLANVAGVIFHSLQLGDGAEQAGSPPAGMCLVDNTDKLVDFSETAALVSNLDLVITIDTAVAHLAGALGKQVWLLLPNAPDWRWLLERDDSPWYPTMRLFRQKKPGDWDEVMARVAGELGTIVATFHGRQLQGCG